MCLYLEPEREARLRAAFERSGRRLDLGKSCVRFKRAADLPLDAIGEIIASTTPEQYVAAYEAARGAGTAHRRSRKRG